jgi:intron-binding protein aquarius
VGSTNPAFVRAEIAIEVGRLADNVRKEWESLRPDDVVYLLAVQSSSSTQLGIRDDTAAEGSRMTHLRTAEIVQVLDEQGRPLRQPAGGQTNGYQSRPRVRKLLVNLDAASFKADTDLHTQGKPDIYSLINVVARRKGRENNFKSILETMQKLIVSDMTLPPWLQDIFLGYGDPAGAQYTQLPNRLQSVDFRDTFLDWSHLVENQPASVLPMFSSPLRVSRQKLPPPQRNDVETKLDKRSRALVPYVSHHTSCRTLVPTLLMHLSTTP